MSNSVVIKHVKKLLQYNEKQIEGVKTSLQELKQNIQSLEHRLSCLCYQKEQELTKAARQQLFIREWVSAFSRFLFSWFSICYVSSYILQLCFFSFPLLLVIGIAGIYPTIYFVNTIIDKRLFIRPEPISAIKRRLQEIEKQHGMTSMALEQVKETYDSKQQNANQLEQEQWELFNILLTLQNVEQLWHQYHLQDFTLDDVEEMKQKVMKKKIAI